MPHMNEEMLITSSETISRSLVSRTRSWKAAATFGTSCTAGFQGSLAIPFSSGRPPLRFGTIPAAINPALTEPEIAYVLEDLQPRLALFDAKSVAGAPGAAAAARAIAVAEIATLDRGAPMPPHLADPADAAIFDGNAQAYLTKLDALDREVRQAIAQIPEQRRKVISTHDAFGYFAAAYGIEFIAPLGVSTESEASARDIAGIITQIKDQKIPAVFLENISDPRLIQRIAGETGARVGGTLYSDSLTDEKGAAPTYIELVRHNIKTLTSALAN